MQYIKTRVISVDDIQPLGMPGGFHVTLNVYKEIIVAKSDTAVDSEEVQVPQGAQACLNLQLSNAEYDGLVCAQIGSLQGSYREVRDEQGELLHLGLTWMPDGVLENPLNINVHASV